MDIPVYEAKIKEKIGRLKEEDIIYFVWICAIRALPFLGRKGNFYYWDEDKQAKYLYSLLYALDHCLYASMNTKDRIDITIYNAVVEAANTIYDAYDVRASYKTRIPYGAKTSIDFYSANSAKNAAKAASTVVYVINTVNGLAHTNRVNIVYNVVKTAYDAFAYYDLKIDYQTISLQDLDDIYNGDAIRNTTPDIYGPVWNNFKQALADIGCDYWAQLYTQIFTSGFQFNKEALEWRLNVPASIREQGARAVANYLEEMEQGAEFLHEARIIILGEKGSGKTCLARRLIHIDAPMTEEFESTPGVDTSLWKLTGDKMNVHIWDFAGHTVTHAVHQFFLSERSLYIIVYDGRTETRNRMEYWLDHMKNYGGNSQAFILINKRDGHTPEIPIRTLQEKYPIAGYHIFSIKDDRDELQAFRKEVADYIKHNPSWNSLQIPANYYKVKQELEGFFMKGESEKNTEHITLDQFNEIVRKYKIGHVESLLQDLHALGVCLWYKDVEEFETLVLNPEWISYGVYTVINWVYEQKKHTVSPADFGQVFAGKDASRYPADKHSFIYQLMMKYELAYECGSETNRYLIIPHLLGEDRPDTLPEFPVNDSLMLCYKADQPLPPHTISRFIVRHSEEIRQEENSPVVWRYGVVLEDGKGSTALIRESDRSVEVSVKGTDRTVYFDKIRKTLNEIFNSYKSKKPELLYRVERGEEVPEEVDRQHPLWVPGQQLLSHYLNEQPLYDYISNKNIPLQSTVIIYNINAESVITGGEGNIIASRNTFNFKNCNITLQGHLNHLARLLERDNHTEEATDVKEAIKDLDEALETEKPEEIKKEGWLNSVKQILEELGDEKSKLHKIVNGMKKGVKIAREIAKAYNDIAQWAGLPQIPRPFLSEEE